MENIYKIRVRTNPDPRGLYPSERRYSASTVLGLGVVHLALAATAILLACLSATVYQKQFNTENAVSEATTTTSSYQATANQTEINAKNASSTTTSRPEVSPTTLETIRSDFPDENATANDQPEVRRKRETSQEEHNKGYNPCESLAIASSLLALAALGSGLTGLLAWKRWYIDHNIRWFFSMSLFSTVMSCITLLVTALVIFFVNKYNNTESTEAADSFLNIIDGKSAPDASMPHKELVLAYNIIIASFLELMWSALSTKIAYVGMLASYPEDMINRSRGKIEVNTIHKGNKKGKIIPPDLINHFPPVPGKIAKYFPRKELPGNLPKAESNSEYMDRVKKFLSSNPDSAK